MQAMTYVPASDRYEQMRYRRCGRSGIKLPEISLGLWQNFGEERPLEHSRAIVRRAFDLGITHFDLANNYGPPYGSAERVFGRIMADDLRPHRDELIISTKAGYDMWPGPYGNWGSRKYLLASLDQSLGRMGLDYVDIFYSHRVDPDTPLEETMGALDTAVRQGKALYAGISSYSGQRTAEAARILRDLGTPLLIHQPSYSLLNRWIEEDLLDVLGDEGVGAIVFSPLAQGMLTTKYLDGIPEDSRAAVRDGSLSPDLLTEESLRPRALAERDGTGARAVAGADGARVDAARPARDLDARRRQQRPPARGEPRRARAAHVHRRRAAVDRRARRRGRDQPLGVVERALSAAGSGRGVDGGRFARPVAPGVVLVASAAHVNRRSKEGGRRAAVGPRDRRRRTLAGYTAIDASRIAPGRAHRARARTHVWVRRSERRVRSSHPPSPPTVGATAAARRRSGAPRPPDTAYARTNGPPPDVRRRPNLTAA